MKEINNKVRTAFMNLILNRQFENEKGLNSDLDRPLDYPTTSYSPNNGYLNYRFSTSHPLSRSYVRASSKLKKGSLSEMATKNNEAIGDFNSTIKTGHTVFLRK